MSVLNPPLYSASCIKRLEKPVLTKDDVPYEASMVFNAGVAKYHGQYVMVFRNEYGVTEETYGKGIRIQPLWVLLPARTVFIGAFGILSCLTPKISSPAKNSKDCMILGSR